MNETAAAYFESRWASSDDPWDHAGRWYETRKYDVTVAALPLERYHHAVEPACGVGLLTARLARRADAVTASDRFAGAVMATQRRCVELAGVTVGLGDVRDGPLPVSYDLAVLGECLYYFGASTVVAVLGVWHQGCAPGGHVVLVHHRPPVDEHVLTGDAVHAVARELLGPPVVSVQDPGFLLDVFPAPA